MNELVMLEEKEALVVDTRTIAEKIYTIRGLQVMLDSDLAELYGYEVKRLNEQVRRNIKRFPEDFMFQLNDDEVSDLWSQFATANIKTMSRSNPFVFTEQGVNMLAAVLKSEIAIKQSIMIMRAFKEMRHYLMDNQYLIGSQDYLRLSMQVNDNTKAIQDIRENMVTKNNLEEVMKEFIGPNLQNEYLFLNGEKFKADLAYEQIYNSAKHTIYIVDNYIGPKTLVHLKDLPSTTDVIIFSDNIRKGLHLAEFTDFQTEYPNVNICFQTTNGKYHDRYIALDYNTPDEIIYHCGPSSKDAGNKIASISKVRDNNLYHGMIDELLLNPLLVLI